MRLGRPYLPTHEVNLTLPSAQTALEVDPSVAREAAAHDSDRLRVVVDQQEPAAGLVGGHARGAAAGEEVGDQTPWW